MSEIASKVKAIIVDKLGVDENEVTPNATYYGVRESFQYHYSR